MRNDKEVERVFVCGYAAESPPEDPDDGFVHVAGRPVAPRGE